MREMTTIVYRASSVGDKIPSTEISNLGCQNFTRSSVKLCQLHTGMSGKFRILSRNFTLCFTSFWVCIRLDITFCDVDIF